MKKIILVPILLLLTASILPMGPRPSLLKNSNRLVPYIPVALMISMNGYTVIKDINNDCKEKTHKIISPFQVPAPTKYKNNIFKDDYTSEKSAYPFNSAIASSLVYIINGGITGPISFSLCGYLGIQGAIHAYHEGKDIDNLIAMKEVFTPEEIQASNEKYDNHKLAWQKYNNAYRNNNNNNEDFD